jgi:hypothetical protein
VDDAVDRSVWIKCTSACESANSGVSVGHNLWIKKKIENIDVDQAVPVRSMINLDVSSDAAAPHTATSSSTRRDFPRSPLPTSRATRIVSPVANQIGKVVFELVWA